MTTEPAPDDKCAVVFLSGGMDSATTAYEATRHGHKFCVLHISYG